MTIIMALRPASSMHGSALRPVEHFLRKLPTSYFVGTPTSESQFLHLVTLLMTELDRATVNRFFWQSQSLSGIIYEIYQERLLSVERSDGEMFNPVVSVVR